MIDLDELERLCEEALPEPWHCPEWHDLVIRSDSNRKLVVALRNAATELIAMARRYQWLPIETAPDDMTESVVVRWTNSDGEECREFDHREEGIWVGWHEYAENVEIIGGHGVSYEPLYTHWMPLPDAPQEQKR